MQFCILEWTQLYEFDPSIWYEPSTSIKPNTSFYVELVDNILSKTTSVDYIPIKWNGTYFLVKKDDLHIVH